MSDVTLVYDDDCGFCTWWANYVAERSDVRLVGFSELTDELRGRLPSDYEECSHLVTDDRVYSCGASVEEAIVRTDTDVDFRPLVDFFRQFDGYGRVREWAYREGANRRDLLGKLRSDRPSSGRGSERSE